MSNQKNSFTFIEQKEPAGSYVLSKHPYITKIPVTEKPNWFRRLMMKLLLNIKWIDNKNND